MKILTPEQTALLLARARKGDTTALDDLIENFKPMVSSIARGYFLVDGDDEDLVQEGMIGLYKAVQSFKESGGASFSSFAYLCIVRQVQTAIRSGIRKKSTNAFLSISNQGSIDLSEEGDGVSIFLVSSDLTPEEKFLQLESKHELSALIKKQLSDLEFSVLGFYLKGFSHVDISQKLNIDLRSVANAIARMRMKLKDLFGENISGNFANQ